jgi:hypothetical protein
MQQKDAVAQTPERRGPPLVAERLPHAVEGEIGVQSELLMSAGDFG